MDEENARKFLKMVGATKVAERVKSNGWLVCSCPLARWTHKGGQDSSPSFAVRIEDGEPSAFNCMSCGRSGGTLRTLVKMFQEFSGDNCWNLMMFVINQDGERFTYKDPGMGMVGLKKKQNKQASAESSAFSDEDRSSQRSQGTLLGEAEEPDLPKIHDKAREQFEKFHREIPRYIIDRGFDVETCIEWGFLTEKHWTGNRRLVFPIRDVDGELLAYSRRVLWDKPRCQKCGYDGPEVKFASNRKDDQPRSAGGCPKCDNKWIWPKYQHSKGFHRNYYLYGEHMLDTDHRIGVIVEGNLDPVSLWQCGVKNAVATLGSNPGEGWPDPANGKPGEQLYRMMKFFDGIVLLADGDAPNAQGERPGRIWIDKIESFFEGMEHKMWVRSIECPSGTDPGDLSPEQVRELLGGFDVWR